MEDWTDSMGHCEYSLKAWGRVDVPRTLEGHNEELPEACTEEIERGKQKIF